MSRSTVILAASAMLLWTAVLPAATTEERVDILMQEVERLRAEVGRAGGADNKPADSSRTTLGGYGELHYNNLDSGKSIDFHRFVLFVGHRFSERLRLFSELELEHSNTENGGAVELEQAYLEFDLTQKLRARGGLFLIPVGILNETHEPPVFYGVERNPVEKHVIPATWWEGGAGLSGELAAGIRIDAAVTSGLKTSTTGANAYNIRESRQNVSDAAADSLGYVGRLRWAGIPGVELASSLYYQSDITQSAAGTAPVSATLGEAHAILSRGNFALKALYARWHLIGTDAATGPAAGPVPGADRQNGWYLEPSYKITKAWGLFARYSEWDNQAGTTNTADTKNRQTDVGINYWPHAQVVIKFDVQNQEGAVQNDGFNLGIGYMF